jgi:hypothetical protein
MKPLFAAILAALLLIPAAGAKILISEVLPDPIGTDSGGEAVELYNTEGFSVDISGFIISTESSARDATIPNNSIIPAYGFYLIADAGWTTLKDNLSWANADYEEAMTISNLDSGIALMNGTNLLDAVGWGNASGITEGFYEGTPLPNPKEGESFERKPGELIPYSGNYIDTGNNSADFIIRKNPEPQNSASAPEQQVPGGSLALFFSVEAQQMVSSLYLEDENPGKAGIQIIPEPGKDRLVAIKINSSGNSTFCGSLLFLGVERSFPVYYQNSALISNLSMHYHDSPGNYTAKIKMCNSSEAGRNITFEYEPLLAIAVDSSEILLPPIPIGASYELFGDSDYSTGEKPTISNMGNRNLTISIFSKGFASKESSFQPEIVEFAFSDSLSLREILSGEPKDGPSLNTEGKVPLSIRISIPELSKSGNYSGAIIITAGGK